MPLVSVLLNLLWLLFGGVWMAASLGSKCWSVGRSLAGIAMYWAKS